MNKLKIIVVSIIASAAFLAGNTANAFNGPIIGGGPVNTTKAFDTCPNCSAAQDPDQATLTQIYADGYQLFAFDASTWGSGSTGVNSCVAISDAQALTQRALNAGLKVGVYTRNPICYQTALQALQPYWSQLQFFALDVEVAGDGLPGSIVTQAEVAGVQADNVRPIIYSNAGMWQTQMQGSTAYASLPLWDQVTDGNVQPNTFVPSLNNPAFTPYGGWTFATLRQDANATTYSVNLETVPVDLDSVAIKFLR